MTKVAPGRTKVAFIGTGIMGSAIAGHILDAGYDLTVYNRTKKKADALVGRGATWAESPSAAAEGADVVFTMVGMPADVEDVYLSGDGLIRAARRGSWLIDLTTSSPQLAKDIHDAAEVGEVHAFDCPVTGGQAGAEAGTLTLMVGASEADAADVEPLLETFSSKRFYFGGPGMGQTAKLCNQVSLASCMVGMADALALAEQGGLDTGQVIEMIGAGMGSSRALAELGPQALEGDWRPGFFSEHMLKDIGLALEQAEDLDITLPGAETAFTLYDMLCQIGGARLGTQALSLLYATNEDATAAGLDWSLLEIDSDEHDEGCGCGHDHGDHEHCGCEHGHGGCGCEHEGEES
ncbi:MAG: NAD(P)-dependent oxidoreductase [Atopobiaceae bacterium]|jgi:3-hydroxyisobutyrate dehydrogenase|nr:NAD(P)-dependent oxidoreductase [Atopobiaceae bacterium]